MRERAVSCDVCHGTPGRYPVINRFGTQLYEIVCPECLGDGMSQAEFDFDQQHKADLAKYNAALAETRGASQ